MDDDQPDKEVTRIPTQTDLIKIAREFNRLGVAYVVVGALRLTGSVLCEPRMTSIFSLPRTHPTRR